MAKARHNSRNTNINLETLCLDCGKRGFVTSPVQKGYYEVYEDKCMNCLKVTKHIKCKSIEKLKAELEFCDRNYGINDIVLNAININNTNKVK